MDTVIAAPASYEVRAVIRFLHAEGLIFLVDCLLSWLGWDNNKTLFYNTYHKY